MAIAYLSLGTNLGEKEQNIRTSIHMLKDRAGTIPALSALYETPPWGFRSGNSFLNAALCLETSLTPFDLLDTIKLIEQEMGRPPKASDIYQDRIIDIDILLYGGLILDTAKLVIPHPLMHKRKFVLTPLAEIAPALLHPVLEKTILELSLILA
ncbi:2-amino-4-hydroxy-6-hydroxymethyldihydropteridine diphosphokinase [Bacteroidia bacterium]|nr:2-amino-4-hydroxy-6-hydroxymethyldihydropteridine diphosphokinase [Bacteroidia bacterium]